MTYTISKEFHFSASHQLELLPDDHPCARLHGHNYRVEILLSSGRTDHVGFVTDYGDLKLVSAWIDATLDHRHLNIVFPFNPTAENLAAFIYDRYKRVYPQLSAVRVSETPKTWAEFAQ